MIIRNRRATFIPTGAGATDSLPFPCESITGHDPRLLAYHCRGNAGGAKLATAPILAVFTSVECAPTGHHRRVHLTIFALSGRVHLPLFTHRWRVPGVFLVQSVTLTSPVSA